MDSIIARPTNKVRVMVAEASGCWASEVSAVATALPSASAGPMEPKLMVMPAMTIDATAIIVMLSTVSPFVVVVHAGTVCMGSGLGLRTLVAAAMYTAARMLKMYACTMPVSRPSTVIMIGKMKGVIVSRMPIIIAPLIILRSEVTRRQDAEDVRLHHAGEQAEHRHNDREDEGCNSE